MGKLLSVTIIALCLVLATACWPQQGGSLAGEGAPEISLKETVSLAKFDKEVLRCRREMRQYCAIVQQLMTAGSADPEQAEKALRFLIAAKEQWQVIRKTYEVNPPVPYVADSKFKSRLADVADAFEDMESHLQAGRARRSFQACGFACGLFGAMHEENGLIYAVDRLFALRKTLKTLTALEKAEKPEAVRSVLPDLLQHRNRALLAPCPSPEDLERCEQYRTAVKALSSALDDLAIAVARGDAKAIPSLLDHVAARLNTAYGIAL